MAFHIDVMAKGYFPVEIPPAFSTNDFARLFKLSKNDPHSFAKKFSRCAFHSIPRLQHSRRMLGIPNPLHQLRLVVLLEKCWPEIENHMKKSALSMTRLEYVATSTRGLEKVGDFDAFDRERVIRSSSSRYLLKADLSRFYHTLYTHSIPWSLHTKATAKAKQTDKSLVGNLIDEAVRNTQDKQTLGVPVGPVTSDLISEILGTAIDVELLSRRARLKGLRYVDDYYLYFATRSEAEAVLADLHSVANHFAVEINPLKTRISELPEPIQPSWKSELRSHLVRKESEKDDLLAFFSRAFENSSKYPGNNVLKYAVKQSAGFRVTQEHWPLYESLLIGSLVAEPSLAPTLAPILAEYEKLGYKFDLIKLCEALAEIASYHARFKQGFEIAWALWISKLFGVTLPAKVWAQVSSVDDSVVALLSLDLRDNGLADALDPSAWSQHMQADHLYSENWLLAYEALTKGWLPAKDGSNYVEDDDFFGSLSKLNVEFYDSSTRDPATDDDWISAYS
jgi:Reverse transcriptase (RNA-dependent DNA polymerase)